MGQKKNDLKELQVKANCSLFHTWKAPALCRWLSLLATPPRTLPGEVELHVRVSVCGLCASPPGVCETNTLHKHAGQLLVRCPDPSASPKGFKLLQTLHCPWVPHVPLHATSVTGFKRRRSLIFKAFSVFLICSRSGQIFHNNYVLLPGFVKRTRSPNCRACELWQQPLYCSDLLKCLRHDWLPVLPSPQRSGRL